MRLLVAVAGALQVHSTVGALVDWIHPDYAISPSSRTASTRSSRDRIAARDNPIVKKGTWTVTSSNITAPSKSARDYLSWAPYHWPNCNWCKPNAKQGAASVQNNSTPAGIDTDSLCLQAKDDFVSSVETSACNQTKEGILEGNFWGPEFVILPEDQDEDSSDAAPSLSGPFNSEAVPTPTTPPDLDSISLPVEMSTTTTDHIASQNPSPAGAIQKSKTVKPTCTPSPTKSMPPSATWTSCAYKVRDGKANPDVRSIPNIDSLNKVTFVTISNALAYALTSSDEAAARVVEVLSTWFLQNTTAMTPHANYGQVIRGPGKQTGGYTGIVDFRNMVNVANAVVILRAMKSPRWTPAMNSAMAAWTKPYLDWLQKSEQGQKAMKSANNHITFYYSQLASLYVLMGDEVGAKRVLGQYFAGPYQEQITATGEQPLEAVRTRPWHYRCFNMEAMIANAKLADYLGQDYWTAATKYGGTIKKALDFILKQDPKEEDVHSVIPHVAAVAAAFGDPKGVYAGYMKSKQPSYENEAFWFYNQPAALKHSPLSKARSRRDDSSSHVPGDGEVSQDIPIGANTSDEIQGAPVNASVPRDCPSVFKGQPYLELDLDVYVTCDKLKSFYVPV